MKTKKSRMRRRYLKKGENTKNRRTEGKLKEIRHQQGIDTRRMKLNSVKYGG